MTTRFIFLPESAHFPVTNFPALKKDVSGRFVLAYDASTIETAYWTSIAPLNFSASPNLVVVVSYYMTNASGITNNVVWDVAIEAPAVESADVGTSMTFNAAKTQVSPIPATANLFKQQSVTVSNYGNLAAAGYFTLKVARNATATFDTASNDAYCMAVEFRDSV